MIEIDISIESKSDIEVAMDMISDFLESNVLWKRR